VLALAGYSLVGWKSLCPYCALYWLCSLASFGLFWVYGAGRGESGAAARFLRPSIKHLVAFGAVVLVGSLGMQRYHGAKLELQVARYFALPPVSSPSLLSPYWSVRSTERFEDAPIRLIEYGDFLCSDCLYLHHELEALKREFPGKINVAFQFFPLETRCNRASRRDLHPHACEVTFVAAHDPARFVEIHDEIFANFWRAKRDSAWRADLARRYGAEAALADTAVQGLVRRIVETGAEYAPTSPSDPRGIHATPTMILNNRMIIGTLPYEQLRAIFRALLDRSTRGSAGYLESWVP
jgi:predicted DsbA family dithiol-disulfide isomerase